MQGWQMRKRTWGLLLAAALLVGLFVWVALRAGPLAPVQVTVARVESKPLTPALFGIGTVQARYSYQIGPTYAGRLKRLDVHAGSVVQAGQVLGEMDPVDLNERIRAQDAAVKRTEATRAEALARQGFARTQSQLYNSMFRAEASSRELAEAHQQDLKVANAAVNSAQADMVRLQAERSALQAQRRNLQLVTPVAGLVVARHVDPGTTVVAGQAVLEVIDPSSLWIDTRFDQISAGGLAAGLPASIALRSRSGQAVPGQVQLVEPLADSVTEETMAKIVFAQLPEPLPPMGELSEVTVTLPQQAATPVLPNAAIRQRNGQTGVWLADGRGVRFAPVRLGRADLNGQVQVLEGLKQGQEVVLYTARPLRENSRIERVETLGGGAS